MIELTGHNLTIEQLVAVARHKEPVAALNETVCKRMQQSHEWVLDSINGRGKIIYGVNTGFGSLANKQINAADAQKLSRNLIVLCVCGIGKPLPEDVVRGIMLIRANMLAKGNSGVRPAVAQTLIEMLNAGITPLVPDKGSLGASGDLAPLAHIAVILSRDAEDGDGGFSGSAFYQGEQMSGAEAMQRAGIKRLILEAKEGLALSNGIDFMAACGALAVYDAENLLSHAQMGAALSLEALLGLSAAFDADLHTASNQPGNQKIAATIRSLFKGSQLIDSLPEKVQDAYSLRCTPQVLGPIMDTLEFVRQRFSAAINAATDNPLIFSSANDEEMHAISGGNFHGEGPAMWLDFIGIAVAEIANIAERRIFRMLTPELNHGLPAMLIPSSGLDGGLMMVQYTAAALVSDNKTLAHPDSVDSIPSCANQEDHVSMGANGARHCLEILENVRFVLAAEFITAAQAIDLRAEGPARLGKGTVKIFSEIRRQVSFMEHDRPTTPDIEKLSNFIHAGSLTAKISEYLLK
ncbi:MAG: histidine ammonia-lyase [Chloroflexi bacterium HGW-Chloroflexi-10]|nr:MAG: histidine ammonia-lyase [Chloroflexi bacterium HGW-Chloroflexi-10]